MKSMVVVALNLLIILPLIWIVSGLANSSNGAGSSSPASASPLPPAKSSKTLDVPPMDVSILKERLWRRANAEDRNSRQVLRVIWIGWDGSREHLQESIQDRCEMEMIVESPLPDLNDDFSWFWSLQAPFPPP